jgi:prevent-host-death family protein
MIKTLRESKARLSELVAAAAGGEEVIITVHGTPKARLVAATGPAAPNTAAWVQRLRTLHRECATGKKPTDNKVILDALRAERA